MTLNFENWTLNFMITFYDFELCELNFELYDYFL